MTGRELYEMQQELFPHMDLPRWEDLTPWRQANWNASAADFVAKKLEDEDD